MPVIDMYIIQNFMENKPLSSTTCIFYNKLPNNIKQNSVQKGNEEIS
jgi:hypothetical protein